MAISGIDISRPSLAKLVGMTMSAFVSAAVTALLFASPVLAGPAEDWALREAAGCWKVPDLAGVQAALRQGASPTAASSDVRAVTPLMCASLSVAGRPDPITGRKAVEVTKILLAAGARLGPTDRDILFMPIAAGNLELVRLLVDSGASPVAKLDGFTPPELARNYGQSAVYDYLISRGGIPVDAALAAQIDLIEAASHGDISSMSQALEGGARIDGKGPSGQTALIAAVRMGVYTPHAADAIAWLLDRGADPNEKGESGFTDLEGVPLHIFVFMTNGALGAKPTRPDVRPDAERTLALLLKAGAKVSGMDTQGRTPLHWAAKSDNLGAAEVLIRQGARVMARDLSGRTPLDYAESGPMIRLLTTSGATER